MPARPARLLFCLVGGCAAFAIDIETVATGLHQPSGVAFDAQGRPYVIEAGTRLRSPRLVRIERGGVSQITAGGDGPWNGVAFYKDSFYVADGGRLDGGKLWRIAMDGSRTVLVSGLPTRGEGRLAGPAIAPDGGIYFAVGAGPAPCNTGRIPCNGAVLRVPPEGGDIERVAWGFQDPRAMTFSSDGNLYLLDRADRKNDHLLWIIPGVSYEHPSRPAPLLLLPLSPTTRAFDIKDLDIFIPQPGRIARYPKIGHGPKDPLPVKGLPVATRFDPAGKALYVVDAEAGALLKITFSP